MSVKVDEFLKKYNSSLSDVDPTEWINNFYSEMERGLNKKKCSLRMSHSFIFKKDLKVDKKKKCIVLDAGGTNMRGAVVSYQNNKIVFSNLRQTKFPVINDRDKFYTALKDFVVSISKEHLDIGFCFSYYCLMKKNLDGKAMFFGKGIKMDKIVGSYVASELKSKFDYPLNVYILNDTVASNLGLELENKKPGNYIAYILGTGTNIAYYENDELIDIESCGFNKFKPSVFEQEVIDATGDFDHFEKTCSGRYFNLVINNALNHANKDKLIKLKKKADLTMPNYCDLKSKEFIEIFKDEESVKIAKEIIKKLIEKSALTNALVMSAVIKKTNRKGNFYISLEGTTIKKLPGYKKTFKKYISIYSPDTKVEYLESDSLNLKGAYYLSMK